MKHRQTNEICIVLGCCYGVNLLQTEEVGMRLWNKHAFRRPTGTRSVNDQAIIPRIGAEKSGGSSATTHNSSNRMVRSFSRQSRGSSIETIRDTPRRTDRSIPSENVLSANNNFWRAVLYLMLQKRAMEFGVNRNKDGATFLHAVKCNQELQSIFVRTS